MLRVVEKTIRPNTKIHQSPDNHTMLNHTTLLFAPNLPRIKWNVNKFALIIAQKSPDNHTILFQLSTFIAFINKFLSAWKAPESIWMWMNLVSPLLQFILQLYWSSEFWGRRHRRHLWHRGIRMNWDMLAVKFLHQVASTKWHKAMIYVPEWTRIGIIAVAAPLIDLKAVFAEHRWGLLNHTAPLFAQFSEDKNGN